MYVRNRKQFQEPLLDESNEYWEDDNFKSGKKPVSRKSLHLSKTQWYIVAALTVFAGFVRFYRLDHPTSVVFDEVHFGGFASKYIHGRFFMDVHPPLAKMLLAAAGWFGGFDGNFDFSEIGKDYIEPQVPYVAMRLLPAIMGWLLVPISYLTVKLSGHSTPAATLSALFVTFDNALVTQSRLILLDSPLLFFTALTALSWVQFCNQSESPFSSSWWFWLTSTGLFLGLSVSVKWVGLFIIALIGLSTIKQLWDFTVDSSVPPSVVAKHFFARAFSLIAVPVVVYLALFQIHFFCLRNSGDGNGFMSPEFQSTLSGGGIGDTPADVAYGSKVYIRHLNTNGGYLHSHDLFYPTGSKQQQITLYPHRDENNWWVITKIEDPEVPYNETELEWVKNGDIVRLLHPSTGKRLHSHDVRAPITEAEHHNEVSGYEWGDINDHWRVEIIDHDDRVPESADRLMAIYSRFRLVHIGQHCHLFSHDVKLPKWASEQQEVTCMKSAKLEKTLWLIDTNVDPRLPEDAPRVNYRTPGFFKKFWELQKRMWTINNGLTDSHPFDSRPSAWPLINRGISFWSKDSAQIYLLGNPIIWWAAAAAVGLYIAVNALLILRQKRGYNDGAYEYFNLYFSSAGFFFLGWFLHYLPFFLMGRQLFLHHYLPAIYFGILLTGVTFDLFTSRLNTKARWLVLLVSSLVVVYVFVSFSPLVYGTPWTKQQCIQHRWRSRWDFDCDRMINNPDPSELITLGESISPQSTDTPIGQFNPSDVLQEDLNAPVSILPVNEVEPSPSDALQEDLNGPVSILPVNEADVVEDLNAPVSILPVGNIAPDSPKADANAQVTILPVYS
ncbi:PMT-domain-containing protein [Basidiobolus meristosporus CBS 931.73]|uniref:Dolichyl-phosphate-mannose--protein mannosyltransferase n=1 Tax=Basidiobolus meristosporus CBS 931.73 TaxID=1314790 RepID=A0A1Y1XSX8_9FUNG|nr:PMT-domain-containing protein [Basidiobolus meristosporus CBS 931.73]|eukprot:ORX88851.1 PMT-domain-containing protein [Basidiobolus meristosporus CBS 931.73]